MTVWLLRKSVALAVTVCAPYTKKPGVLRDIGIESEYPETGVVVPKDGSALQMQLKGPTGAVLEKRFVRLKPGDKLVVKWKP